MTREEKSIIVQELADKLGEANNFYLADTSAMTVADISDFRRQLFNQGLSLRVVKNTLMKLAMEKHEDKYQGLYEQLVGTTAVMFTDTANAPAKVMKDFRKKNDKPLLKAAFIDNDIFIGDETLKQLAELKSKEELIGEIIGLLQSPAKNVISALQSGGANLSGILKTLSEREEN